MFVNQGDGYMHNAAMKKSGFRNRAEEINDDCQASTRAARRPRSTATSLVCHLVCIGYSVGGVGVLQRVIHPFWGSQVVSVLGSRNLPTKHVTAFRVSSGLLARADMMT